MGSYLPSLFIASVLLSCSLSHGQNIEDYGMDNLQHQLADTEKWHNVWLENPDIFKELLTSPESGDGLRDGNYYSDKALRLASTGQSNASTACLNATAQLLIDLGREEQYALTVLDATGKLPSGILLGNTWWVGSFGQCRNTTEYQGNKKVFAGQYCTASLKLTGAAIIPGLSISLGLCVPDVCSNEDVMILFKDGLMEIPVLESTVEIYGVLCATDKEWSIADIVAVCICGTLCLFLLMGTVYDILTHWKVSEAQVELHVAVHASGHTPTADVTESLAEGDTETPQAGPDSQPLIPLTTQRQDRDLIGRILLCFSVRTNMRKLVSAKQREGMLSALNGIRVLSMCWVILGHTHLMTSSFVDNGALFLNVVQRFTFQAVATATVSVDTFFFLSGLLVTYLTLRQLRTGTVPWHLFYFHRFWRLTPMYALIIFLWSTLYLHLPTGIGMRGLDDSAMITSCHKYWWSNLLYINNFVPYSLNDECLAWSWYLANDMQFFVVSPLFILLLHWCSKQEILSRMRSKLIRVTFMLTGVGVIGVVLLASVMATGIISTKKHLGIGLLPQPGKGAMTDDSVYVKPWTRIPTYLVGMLTGYFLVMTGGNFRMKKWVNLLGWLVAAAMAVTIVYGLYPVNKGDVVYNQAVDSLYIATHRTAWSLCLAWVVISCTAGYGGPINTLLSWEAWIPLGRLTYGAYLLHPMIIYLYSLSLKQAIHYTDINMVWLYLGTLVIAYMAAAIFSVGIEAPTMALEKVMFQRKAR